jgi:hypothetical protein
MSDGSVRTSRLASVFLALGLAAMLLPVSAAAPTASPAAALSKWTGGIDLYRTGVFTTQQSWLWCTAADVQLIRNIVDRQGDHSKTNQSRYFAYMRDHNRYAIPVSDGVDPAGWTAGLRQYVDARYRLFQHRSFDQALRDAVANLRRTNLPVAVAVQHGNHGWVLTGFTATADPAATSKFTVTSVRVTGPLWGLQSRTYGYDMKPDTKLTPAQFNGFWTAWHYAKVSMAYEGRWISIQGVATATAPAPSPKPPATPAPSLLPSVVPSASASAGVSASATAAASPDPAAPSGLSPPVAVTPSPPASSASLALPGTAAIVGLIAAIALVAGLALRARVSPQRRG